MRLSRLKAAARAADSHTDSRLGTDGNQNQTRSTEKGAADDAALSHGLNLGVRPLVMSGGGRGYRGIRLNEWVCAPVGGVFRHVLGSDPATYGFRHSKTASRQPFSVDELWCVPAW